MNSEIKKLLKGFVLFLVLFSVMPFYMKSFLPVLPIFLLGIFSFVTHIWQTMIRTGNYDYNIIYSISFLICLITGLIFVTIYLSGSIYPDTLSYIIFYVCCGFYIILVTHFYYYLKRKDFIVDEQ